MRRLDRTRRPVGKGGGCGVGPKLSHVPVVVICPYFSAAPRTLQRAPTISQSITTSTQALALAIRTIATKGAIDELSVAEAIMHELKLKFAKPAGNWRGPAPVEAWDEETRCWTPFCGDDTFLLAVTAALRKVFVRVGFTDAFVDGKLVFKAVALEPDERFGTISGFVGRIAKAARLLLKPQRALDDEEACKHMVHFSCGRTVHFDRPFDEQIQWGQREDRASRCTGKPFVDWSAPDELK